MKHGLVLLLICLVTTGTFVAGPTEAHLRANSTDTQSAVAPTEIETCTAITQPGTYVLTADVVDSTEEACIQIQSDDVVFDGDGHTVDGIGVEATFGVAVTSSSPLATVSNVTVTELTVSDWETGISYVTTVDGTVQNVTVTENTEGISFSRSQGSTVTAVTATNNGECGVCLILTSDVTVTNSATEQSEDTGIEFIATLNSTVTNNSVSQNGDDGLVLFNSFFSVVDGNTITSNGDDGVGLTLSGGATFSDNVVTANGDEGIDLSNATATRFSNTTATENAGWTFESSDNATNNTAETMILDTATVSFQARDVAIDSVASPPDLPNGQASVGPVVRIANTSATSWLDLTVHYTDEDMAAANVSEESLVLWRYDDGEWSQLGGDVDADANTISVNVTEFHENTTVIALAGTSNAEMQASELSSMRVSLTGPSAERC